MHERKCLTTRFEKRVKEPMKSLDSMESKMKNYMKIYKKQESIEELKLDIISEFNSINQTPSY